jgi:hypothetical protein
MNWNAFNPHNDSYEDAFEAFSIQLFEHYLLRTYKNELIEFFALSGSGGDGGVEAYGKVMNGTIGLQAKWFRTALTSGQVNKIRASILTAKKVRPEITEYIICLPKRINSRKASKGNKTTTNDEQQKLAFMVEEIKKEYPTLKITWWFHNHLLEQLQYPDCEFIERYWFGNNFLTLEKLKKKFSDQKKHAWLKTRYAPDLNAEGVIAEHYSELCLGEDFKGNFKQKLNKLAGQLTEAGEMIDRFVVTIDDDENLKADFINIKTSFDEYFENIAILKDAVENNQWDITLKVLPEYYVWTAKLALDRNRPTNIQRPMIRQLSRVLDEIHKIHVTEYLSDLSDHLRRKIKLFFGAPGTGKTQGLAFCTAAHLDQEMPALILPAKGTPCNSWTEILSSTLECPGKNAEELLTALEALAILNLQRQAQTEPGLKRLSTALICIDGLEEDVSQWGNWYNRINDTENLTAEFPRTRFLFSARGYFNDHDQISEHPPFDKIQIPDEGDVPVWEAAEIYFSPQHFNIRNVSDAVMARIEGLYALKLFCELYKDQDLATRNDVHTDLRSLLIKKIEVLDAEFKRNNSRTFSPSSQPVSDVLVIITAQFYNKTQLDRRVLLEALVKAVPSLSYSELEQVLDFLTDHAVLTAGYRETDNILQTHETVYYVSYQSIIEHVITEDIYNRIIENRIDHIPEIILNGIIAPRDMRHIDPEAVFPNETIVEGILKRVFLKTGKLVGDNGYLSKGLEPNTIPGLQMVVLAVANDTFGERYDAMVGKWLELGHWHQQQLFIRLIRPASKLRTYFGTLWLHKKLMGMSTVYARDQFLWKDRSKRNNDSEVGLESAIYPFSNYDTSLYPFDTFDQEPLIYAWCLSSPNRSFRRELRSSLLNWANLNIGEWMKLLNLMFEQQDTQIIEDLASITLGLSHTLKEASDVKLVADWSLDNLFAKKQSFYSSRAREGFRAIVEKAVELGVITNERAILARPTHVGIITLIPLEKDVLLKNQEQYYPIVSDLSWYVIDDAYDAFLQDGYKKTDFKKRDNPSIHFLKEFADKYSITELSPHTWASAAAIAFIRRQFGFTEKSGSLVYLPSGGEKGEILHFAEKYVWQAVYYLQGYLSEQLKLREHDHFLETYSALTHLPNPSEGVMHHGELINDYADFPAPGWVIPQNLVNSISNTKPFADTIPKEIDGDYKLNLHLWLNHKDEYGKSWTHLFNKIMLEDKSGAVYGRVTANALLINKPCFKDLLEIIKERPKDIYFLSSFDSLYAHPDATFYTNPSDVIANKFLVERESQTELFIDEEECHLNHTITKVTKADVNDEISYYLPSKLIRNLAGIENLKGKRLKDAADETIGFVTSIEDASTKDEQYLTCILTERIEPQIKESGSQLIWCVEVFKRTTLPTEKSGFFSRRTRKYLVWENDKGFQTLQVWDKESSN